VCSSDLPRFALRALSKAFLFLEDTELDKKTLREECKALITKSFEMDSGNAFALAFIADVYDIVFEDPGTALSYSRLALRINPGIGYAYASLGGLELRRGNYREAHTSSKRAVRQLENTSFEVFANMRHCLSAISIGDFTAAQNAAARASLLAPNSLPPLRHLYSLFIHFGENRKARDILQRIRKIEPDFSLKRIRTDKEYPAFTIREANLHFGNDVEL